MLAGAHHEASRAAVAQAVEVLELARSELVLARAVAEPGRGRCVSTFL
jgi:hypothetical protein